MEFFGKTVEQAIEEGLKTLNIDKEDAIITVIDEGTSGGFLGLGGKKAKVEIEIKQKDSEKAIKFLEGLFKILNVKKQIILRLFVKILSFPILFKSNNSWQLSQLKAIIIING
jgi:spoIIIJ-associated protein